MTPKAPAKRNATQWEIDAAIASALRRYGFERVVCPHCQGLVNLADKPELRLAIADLLSAKLKTES